MQITSSYDVKIVGRRLARPLRVTTKIYRDALEYLIPVIYEHWKDICAVPAGDPRFNYTDALVHTAGTHTAICDFDDQFYKMPSYFRRACVKDAMGDVSSYVSNYENWVAGGKQGAEPKLTAKRHACPTFYKDNMYKAAKAGAPAQIKLFDGKDWVWMDLPLRQTDLKYIQKYFWHANMSAPTLEKRHGSWQLRFAFTETVHFPDKAIQDQKICAVDLGINKDAVCCIMDAHGTVLARAFIDFPSEKDLIYRILNRIRKLQRQYGNKNGAVKNAWAYAKRLNDELARHIAAAIFQFAADHDVDCIVFEFLDMKGRLRGRKKQRLAMWKKNTIQKIVEHRAHRAGMRFSHICAWGTSALAFDGSGRIIRGRKNLTKREIRQLIPLLGTKKPMPKDGRAETYTNKETCTFQNGKEYNCDLSASYNIGARYFIRSLLAETSETDHAEIIKLIPDAEKAPSHTLNTLKSLWAFYNKPTGQQAAGA
ncbi:MAG: transposase [Lachnospiraceae bacterium]|nr:transposase [Lachnospiraceae bacterium]